MQTDRKSQSSLLLETGNAERKSQKAYGSVAVESRRVVGGGETHGLDRTGKRGYCRDCEHSRRMTYNSVKLNWWRCNHFDASVERRATFTHNRICDVGRYATRKS